MPEPCKEAKELAKEIVNAIYTLNEHRLRFWADAIAQKIQAVIDKAKEDK